MGNTRRAEVFSVGVHDRLPLGRHSLVHPWPTQDLHGFQPRHSGHRIAGECADLHGEALSTHTALVEVRHDIGPPGDGRQREAAADDLAQRAQVGGDAVVGLCAVIGEAVAGHHLVEDQHDPAPGRFLPQAREEALGGRENALQRLDDDARDLALELVEQLPHSLQIVVGRDHHVLLDTARDTGAVGNGVGEVDQLLRGQRHQRLGRHAVVSAFELEDLVAAGEGAGEPHGVHIRLTAGGNVADLLGAGHVLDDLLGQRNPGAVVGEEGQPAPHLLGDGVGDFLVAVPEDHRARADQQVDELVAVLVPDAASLPAGEDHAGVKVAETGGGEHLSGARLPVGQPGGVCCAGGAVLMSVDLVHVTLVIVSVVGLTVDEPASVNGPQEKCLRGSPSQSSGGSTPIPGLSAASRTIPPSLRAPSPGA